MPTVQGWPRDAAGSIEMVVGSGALAAGERYVAGFVRDADGKLCVGTAGPFAKTEQGFVRDAAGRVAVVLGGAGTFTRGFLRDTSDAIVVTATVGTPQLGLWRDTAGRLSCTGV